MNVIIWMLAGAGLGWIGISYLRFNEQRGMAVSMVIGVVGGFLGGKVIAPMFTAVAAIPADFSASALFFALVVAAVSLAVGNFVVNRYGV
jgi:uncharacterized membrane protein YeaQ/YmgE (transglycosylase-associated protein family)